MILVETERATEKDLLGKIKGCLGRLVHLAAHREIKMKTHALQLIQEPSKVQPKTRSRRSSQKSARTIAGSGTILQKKGAAKDGRKQFGAQKLSYKEAFKELAAQANSERLEWTEWDADSGGLA